MNIQTLKKIGLLTCIALAFSSNISISHAATNSGQTTTGVVERIYLTGGYYFIRFAGADTCAKKSSGFNEYYYFLLNNPQAKN